MLNKGGPVEVEENICTLGDCTAERSGASQVGNFTRFCKPHLPPSANRLKDRTRKRDEKTVVKYTRIGQLAAVLSELNRSSGHLGSPSSLGQQSFANLVGAK